MSDWDDLKLGLKWMIDKLDQMESNVALLATQVADLHGRISTMEGEPVPLPPTIPSPGTLREIPFKCPPLLYNSGSWDNASGMSIAYSLDLDRMTIQIGQEAQEKERVVRHDYGFQDPKQPIGRGGFLREPPGRWRRYEVFVQIPDPYDNRAEMTNLFQAHTDTTTDPPWWSFFLWTTQSYWRLNGPDGYRKDFPTGDIQPGHTYHLEVEAFWSPRSDGSLKAWQDGEIVFHRMGPNYKPTTKPAYIMIGPYAPSTKQEFSNTFVFSGLKVGDI